MERLVVLFLAPGPSMFALSKDFDTAQKVGKAMQEGFQRQVSILIVALNQSLWASRDRLDNNLVNCD